MGLGPYWNTSGYPSKVVTFKPTVDAKDWWYNLKSAVPKAISLGPGGRTTYYVGSGFVDQYEGLKKQGYNPEYICQGSPYVLVTGESLGGALANICAYDLAAWGCRVKYITFACPRVFT